jgi:hypothetical protein
VLLAVGLRSGEQDADPALIGDIAQEPTALVVRPGPLSGGAAGELVPARLGQEPGPLIRWAAVAQPRGRPPP